MLAFAFSDAGLPADGREREQRYRLFRGRVEPLLAKSLPLSLGSALFIDFKEDGTPRVLTTVRPWWWPVALLTPSLRLMLADHGRTLQPFVDKLHARARLASGARAPL